MRCQRPILLAVIVRPVRQVSIDGDIVGLVSGAVGNGILERITDINGIPIYIVLCVIQICFIYDTCLIVRPPSRHLIGTFGGNLFKINRIGTVR